VQGVNWYEAIEFCNWLSTLEGYKPCYEKHGTEKIIEFINNPGKPQLAIDREHDAWHLIEAGNGYRLPTHEQWECACRARTATDYCFGNDVHFLGRYALFQEPSGAAVVGSSRCNGWGLFDMHGNVREWCETALPLRPGNVSRTICGGSSFFNAEFCQSMKFTVDTPIRRSSDLGFRVARF
jgi:formylglycine-generating enzyme required for sulfatase activity